MSWIYGFGIIMELFFVKHRTYTLCLFFFTHTHTNTHIFGEEKTQLFIISRTLKFHALSVDNLQLKMNNLQILKLTSCFSVRIMEY